MKAFLFHIKLQWKIDIRNKNVLLPFYIIPIIFFLVMSAVFNSIIIDYPTVIIPSMIVFSITMAAVLGMPVSLNEIYGTDVKKMFYLGRIPSFVPALVCLVSSFIHFLILSLLIIVFSIVIYQAVLPENIFMFIISLFSFILASEGIGLLIGVFSKKQSDIAIFGQAVFLPSIILSGAMFSSTMLPDFLQYLSYFLPAKMGMESMSQNSGSFWMIPTMIIILFISIVLSYFKTKKVIQ